MAIWRTENSMLTEVGVDMLNRVKSGDGSGITITKVVAGSGSVPTSQLYQQTSLKGTLKDMNLYRRKVLENGTELSFYITNEGFTESYSLRQIGIFATHPDYVGEQLYFIAQSEAEGVDILPQYNDTPVRFDYSLLLEHGNSENITVVIDPLNTVGREEFDDLASEVSGVKQSISTLGEQTTKNIDDMYDEVTKDISTLNTSLKQSIKTVGDNFEAFRADISKGKLLTVDEDKNLIVSGKSKVSGGFLTVNDALDHRALSLSVGGVSTQNVAPDVTAPVYPLHSKVFDIRSNKKNLFNTQGALLKKSSALYGSITVTPTSITTLLATSGAEVPYLGYLMPIEIGKTYVMSYSTMNNSVLTYIQLDKCISDITTAEEGASFNSGAKFTATKPFLLVCCHPNTIATGYGYGFSNVQVEEATAVTAYSQFTGKVIPLPSVIELKSVGGYKDTIEWDGAKWWKVQRIEELVLDGTANTVTFGGTLPAAYARAKVNKSSSPVTGVLLNSPVITSHGNTTDTTDTTKKLYGLTDAEGLKVHFLSSAFSISSNASASARNTTINNWLKAQNTAGTPLKVWYVLANPVVTELTVTEVLEMYSEITKVAYSAEGNAPTAELGYALNTTDETTMYILKALARKSEVSTANTFAIATVM